MSKAKTISQQIEDLQQENERLKEYDKLFEKAIKKEFGCDRKTIHKAIKNNNQFQSEFEQKIINYFGLKSSDNMDEFLSIICSESTLKYVNSKKTDENL